MSDLGRLIHKPPCSGISLRRILKPGGRVLVVDFARSGRRKKCFFGHFHRHGSVDLSEIVAMLVGAEFEVVESGPVGMRELQYAIGTVPHSI